MKKFMIVVPTVFVVLISLTAQAGDPVVKDRGCSRYKVAEATEAEHNDSAFEDLKVKLKHRCRRNGYGGIEILNTWAQSKGNVRWYCYSGEALCTAFVGHD